MKSDLVRRQDVLDIVYLDPGISETNAKMILDLPSVKPKPETCWGCNCPKMEEPKKGRWIFTRYYVWECSECGKNPTIGMGYIQRKSELFRYCPHCGATMVVDDE